MYQIALSKTFLKFEKSPYCFEVLFNQTLIKSLGGTKILSFYEVFNSLSLCFVYLVLFYKPLQTFIIVLLVQYRYTVTIQHPVRLIVDWFFRRCIYIYIYTRSIYMYHLPQTNVFFYYYSIKKSDGSVDITTFLDKKSKQLTYHIQYSLALIL